MVVCGIILIVSFRYCNKCTRNLTIQGKTQLCMKPPGFLVKHVIKLMRTRGNYKTDEEQFFIFSDRSPVKPHHLRTVLRTVLDRLGLDSKLYDVHSLRSGRTCDLAKFGYSVEQIKSMDRWKSNAVYRYLKN